MKKSSTIAYLIVLFALIAFGIYNYNDSEFLKFSLNDLLILAITFFVGTFFYEKYSNTEKTKRKYERIVDKFENNLMSKKEIKEKLTIGDKGEILLKLKKLNNLLNLLKGKAKELKVKKEIETVEKSYEEYNDKLSTHIDAIKKIDLEDLERLKVNIENKCDEIRMKLF